MYDQEKITGRSFYLNFRKRAFDRQIDQGTGFKATIGDYISPTRWPTFKRISMQREFSFYSERAGKHLSGIWSVFGGRLTVTAPDGRQKTTQLGSSTPESLARLMLIELAGQRRA